MPKRTPNQSSHNSVWLKLLRELVRILSVWARQRGSERYTPTSPAPRRPAKSAPPTTPPTPAAPKGKVDTLRRAIDAREHEVWIDGRGEVVRLLPDDHDGDRHQRILVRIAGGDTVLIAHNIDVAPRASVREGDEIHFKGEYVWNDRGGVIHWTHHDPDGSHTGGWLRVGGKTFK